MRTLNGALFLHPSKNDHKMRLYCHTYSKMENTLSSTEVSIYLLQGVSIDCSARSNNTITAAAAEPGCVNT